MNEEGETVMELRKYIKFFFGICGLGFVISMPLSVAVATSLSLPNESVLNSEEPIVPDTFGSSNISPKERAEQKRKAEERKKRRKEQMARERRNRLKKSARGRYKKSTRGR